MRFNAKDSWKSVKILSSGETSHHKNLNIMGMLPPGGNTATMDAENS